LILKLEGKDIQSVKQQQQQTNKNKHGPLFSSQFSQEEGLNIKRSKILFHLEIHNFCL